MSNKFSAERHTNAQPRINTFSIIWLQCCWSRTACACEPFVVTSQTNISAVQFRWMKCLFSTFRLVFICFFICFVLFLFLFSCTTRCFSWAKFEWGEKYRACSSTWMKCSYHTEYCTVVGVCVLMRTRTDFRPFLWLEIWNRKKFKEEKEQILFCFNWIIRLICSIAFSVNLTHSVQCVKIRYNPLICS